MRKTRKILLVLTLALVFASPVSYTHLAKFVESCPLHGQSHILVKNKTLPFPLGTEAIPWYHPNCAPAGDAAFIPVNAGKYARLLTAAAQGRPDRRHKRQKPFSKTAFSLLRGGCFFPSMPMFRYGFSDSFLLYPPLFPLSRHV